MPLQTWYHKQTSPGSKPQLHPQAATPQHTATMLLLAVHPAAMMSSCRQMRSTLGHTADALPCCQEPVQRAAQTAAALATPMADTASPGCPAAAAAHPAALLTAAAAPHAPTPSGSGCRLHNNSDDSKLQPQNLRQCVRDSGMCCSALLYHCSRCAPCANTLQAWSAGILSVRTLAHGALDVAHDEAVLVVQELHAHLRHLLQRQGAICAKSFRVLLTTIAR